LATAKRANAHGNIVGDPLLDLAERMDARTDVRDLSKALTTLTGDEREVLLLVAWEQLSPTEAAAVLGIVPETARTRLRRARQRLRDHLERNEPTTEVSTDAH
jgi:RNA polymerase sigma-70 factor (ECF subfamily)